MKQNIKTTTTNNSLKTSSHIIEKNTTTQNNNNNKEIYIKICEELDKLISPKRTEFLAYIDPFTTPSLAAVKGGEGGGQQQAQQQPYQASVHNYWDNWEIEDTKPAGSAQTLVNVPSSDPLKLSKIFQKFISAPPSTSGGGGGSTLLLLGESGSGKTLSTYYWADKILQKWWDYLKSNTPQQPPPAYLPLFLHANLSSQWTHTGLQKSVLKTIQRYGLKDVPLLVFVDGYDELLMDETPVNLVKHLGLSEYKNARLIVTSKSKTIHNEDDDHASSLYELFNFNGKLQTYHLLPLRKDQILEYLKTQLSWTEEKLYEYKGILEKSKPLRDVLRNPFVLFLLKQTWKTLSHQPFNQLSRWKIYDEYLKQTITTQSKFLTPELQNTLVGSHLNLTDSFQVFASQVAFKALQSKSLTLNYQAALTQLNSPWLKIKELRNRQQFETDLPLKLNATGDSYEFSHKSIFDYFVAKSLLQLRYCEDESITRNDLETLLNRLLKWYPQALLLLYEGWKESTKSDQGAPSKKVLSQNDLLVFSIGVILYNRGNYKEAMEYYLKALSIREQLYGKKDSHTASVYNKIGLTLHCQGNYEQSIQYFFKALAIREEVYGKEDINVASSLNRIGLALRDQGKYVEAKDYLLKALNIRKKVYGNDHPDVENSENNIGGVLKSLGNYEESMKHFMKVITIREKIYGKNHPNTASFFYKIGMVFHDQGKNQEAINYFSKALIIRKKIYGINHPEVGDTYYNIGRILFIQGQNVKAMENSMKALSIYEQVYGKNHPYLASSFNKIGIVLRDQGKNVKAKKYFLKALTIQKKIYGINHPMVGQSYINIGGILFTQGQNVKAMEYSMKALSIYEQVYGKNHPNVGTSFKNIGLALRAQGKNIEAKEYLLKAFNIYEKAYGPKHIKTRNCMRGIKSLE